MCVCVCVNGIDEISLHSHLVLNTYTGRKKRRNGGLLPKPIATKSTNTTNITNNHQCDYNTNIGACVAYLGILNREIICI